MTVTVSMQKQKQEQHTSNITAPSVFTQDAFSLVLSCEEAALTEEKQAEATTF